MKKFLAYFALVATALAALLAANEALNRYFVFSASNANAYKMYRLFIAPEDGEIPILGSSRAEAGFAPLEISPKAFDYGISGSPFSETLLHLRAVLERKKPTLVIVNLDPWGMTKGTFQGLYRYAAPSALVKAEAAIKLELIEKIPGLRCQGETRTNFAEWLNNRLAVTKTMERGAILQKISRTPAEWEYLIGQINAKWCGCDEEIKQHLADLLAANTSYDVVFVVSPISKPWRDSFDGAEHLHALETWLESFPRVHVFDYSNLFDGLDMFMDSTHLNETGARIFSRDLARRMTGIFDSRSQISD